MRTPLAIGMGVSIGVIGAALAFMSFGPHAVDQHVDAPSTPLPIARPADRSNASRVDANQEPVTTVASIAPTTPDYGPPIETPQHIYRCRVKGQTVYSNEACANATIVDESSAVSGFDSRPSERLARLVAQGRNAVPDVPVGAAAVRPTMVDTPECRAMRRQIRDLDAQALQPGYSLRTLDDLRQVRQDVATSMARLHC
jgi:hypothetical protein